MQLQRVIQIEYSSGRRKETDYAFSGVIEVTRPYDPLSQLKAIDEKREDIGDVSYPSMMRVK